MQNWVPVASGRATYRTDVDGLRAVAVLPVVAYHLGVPHMTGGFVGVDVFFVISGYLITGHLQADIAANQFSIIRFYERRLRRIGPALLAMLLVVSLTSLIYVLPVELERYSESLFAALFSVSNFYFWAHANYFDVAAHTRPLLHTWSLAVEEQYYLAFPILLFYATKLGTKGRNALLIGLAVVSFAISAVSVYSHPQAAFYLPHTRAWELLLGAALALGIAQCPAHRLLSDAAAAAGLAMIVVAVTWFDEGMVFPGARALLPCMGAALVLAAGENGVTLVGRLLSWRPLVFIGLISYSVYLWHWPLIVFTRLDNSVLPENVPPLLLNTLVFAASIALGALSWRFVEKPFRNRSRVSVSTLLTWTGGAAAAAAGLAGLFLVMDGFPGRYPAEVARLASHLTHDRMAYSRKYNCFLSKSLDLQDFDRTECLRAGPGTNYLLIGDSHAAQFWYGLRMRLSDSTLREETSAGCVPLRGAGKYKTCNAYTDDLYRDALLRSGVAAIIVSARWSRTDLPRLAQSMDWWNAHHLPVILLGPSPEYSAELPRLLVRARLRHDPNLPRRHLTGWISEVDREMAWLARQKGIKYVSIYERICPGGACRELAAGGVPMAFDNSHLSYAGSIVAVEAMLAHHDLP